MPASDPSPGNRTLERAAAILDAIGDSRVSASELARRTGLSVSTVHRLAVAMVDHAFLRRAPSGEFELGPRFVTSELELASVRLLTELRDRTGETAQLWVRKGRERVCLVTIDSVHELKATLPVGTHLPLPFGSSGGILAGTPDALASLAEHGWVESIGARIPGLGSASAPVTVHGELLGTICLAVPLSRVKVSPGMDYGRSIVSTANELALRLGGAQE